MDPLPPFMTAFTPYELFFFLKASLIENINNRVFQVRCSTFGSGAAPFYIEKLMVSGATPELRRHMWVSGSGATLERL